MFCGLVLLEVTSHSDAIGLDDPQASRKRLLRQLAYETLAHLEYEPFVLPWKTKHHETGILARRVSSDVAEAPIESHQDAAFTPHQAGEVWILRTADALVADSGSIVACLAKQVGDLNREVLVDLESHAAR